MTDEVPVTRARAEFADLVNRVVYGGERIVVTRHGRPIVALVPAADLDRLEAADETGQSVVRLTTASSQHQPARQVPVTDRRFDVAAHHRSPGDDRCGPH